MKFAFHIPLHHRLQHLGKRLSLYLNVYVLTEGSKFWKRFDGPGKYWNFLSVKVWEPCNVSI